MPSIREILDKHGRLSVKAATLSDAQDLYGAGLTSFAAVQLMLAIEAAYDIEFPERMLNRRSFSTIQNLESCIAELAPKALAS